MGLVLYNPKFKVQATLDFLHQSPPGGEQDWAITTVPAPWVTRYTVLTATFAGFANADHDGGDWVYEGLLLHTENIIDGVSFDLYGYAPNNTWGRYLVNIVGE